MPEELTSREQEILNMLLDGISPKDISYKLNISYKTVDYHRGKLYRKLDVQNIQELFSKYSKGAYNRIGSSASLTNKTKKPLIFLIPAAVLIIFIICLTLFLRHQAPSGGKPATLSVTKENPLIIYLNDNEPWGYDNQFYPFKINNSRIMAGDVYTFSYSFVSNIDIGTLYIHFVDRLNEEERFYAMLSSHAYIKGSVIANIEYNGTLTIIATKNASSSDPNANLICVSSTPYTPSQPTIIFTRFELEKFN